MRCAHCGFDCSPDKGSHMSIQTVTEAINFIHDNDGDEFITIGGGEPTINPNFFKILDKCVDNFSTVSMVTNGKATTKAWKLINTALEIEELYGAEKLCISLSQDRYHDPIDIGIRNFYRDKHKLRDSTHLFTVNGESAWGVVNSGRAKRLNIGNINRPDYASCICDTQIIQPNGDIRICGCIDSPIIGNVLEGYSDEWEYIVDSDDFRYSGCYNYYLNQISKQEEICHQ
jgi:hypothetical protein